MKRTITNAEALLEIHQPGVKLAAYEWDLHEYITYSQEKNAIVDENGDEVNALVFVINYEFEVVEEREE